MRPDELPEKRWNLTQSHTYSPLSGRLTYSQLTLGTQTRLDETYQYDAIGNVYLRSQHWDTHGFTETFTYDELNRLKTSAIGSDTKTLEYLADGRIKSKTGVGSGDYQYPDQVTVKGPAHAISSIPGNGNFHYDDNGNLDDGSGRTATWTSFDMPKSISKGGSTSTFVYGPEYQRVRQDRSDGSGTVSTVYAGAQEVEVVGSQLTVKTYWPNGIGVEIYRPGKPTELSWSHADRLGSPVALTDEAGNIREELAFDPWGKRRNTLNNTTPDTLDGKTDNKGFTNHEMLDQLDLVHMNGRVYDPMIGNFMSGDPLVQDPGNGQNFNRYGYVLNNPTNYTDPTGFACAAQGDNVDCGGKGLSLTGFWNCLGDCGGTGKSEEGGGQKGATLQSNGAEKPSAKNPAGSVKDSANNGYAYAKAGGSAISGEGKPKSGCEAGIPCIEIVGHNPNKPQNSGWGSAVGMTSDWITGRGASYRIYDGSTSSSKNMMHARRVNEARQYFYKKNANALAAGKPLAPVTNYQGKFWVDDIVRSGLNPTQQFVGSYRIDIFPTDNDQIRFELSNDSSMKSFLYGVGPDWERSYLQYFGNMRQTYIWAEPIKK